MRGSINKSFSYISRLPRDEGVICVTYHSPPDKPAKAADLLIAVNGTFFFSPYSLTLTPTFLFFLLSPSPFPFLLLSPHSPVFFTAPFSPLPSTLYLPSSLSLYPPLSLSFFHSHSPCSDILFVFG